MLTTTVSRATVRYSGHVQGVGFRYTVSQAAREFEVTGFVQNLMDGRVLLVTEGETAELDSFLNVVSERMGGYIRRAERADEAGPRQHTGFSIQ